MILKRMVVIMEFYNYYNQKEKGIFKKHIERQSCVIYSHDNNWLGFNHNLILT